MRGRQPWRTNRARILRANETSAEERLWSEVRNRELGGFKFVRQAAIGNYFVDFLCRDRKVIVEIDGATHSTDDELIRDNHRGAELNRLGFHVFRATNTDAFENIDGVLEDLLAILESRD